MKHSRRRLAQRLTVLCTALPMLFLVADVATARSHAPKLRVLSSGPDQVTGGDALIEVRVKNRGQAKRLRIERNGIDVTAVFEQVSRNRFIGLVEDLDEGLNDLTVCTKPHRHHHHAFEPHGMNAGHWWRWLEKWRTRWSTALEITNHPLSGPVFSGPHQDPFFCQTEDAGLGPALNDECFAPTQVEYRYRTTAGEFAALDDPDERPADLAMVTIGGRELPYIVRLERGVINRGIYEIAGIDDGADPNPFRENEGWNGKMIMTFGGGGNVGYRQGTGTGGVLNHDALSRGFVVASNSLMVAQTTSNFVVNAETAMMTKERVIEVYGPLRHTIGLGGSGGANQQYLLAHAYPGILDGILPSASFPDNRSPQGAVDCTLLVDYINSTPEGAALTLAQRLAISGLRNFTSCQLLGNVVANTIGASTGCHPIVPLEIRYDPVTNPDGVRCSPVDGQVALSGIDPATGHAEPNFDNDGVQYGLGALESGALTPEQFVHLNENMGGFDSDSVLQPERTSVSQRLIERELAVGLLTTTLHLGGQAYTPAIDLRRVTDDIFDIHWSHWSTAAHERIVRDGIDPRIHSRWIWAVDDFRPHSAAAIDAMDEWLDAIAADHAPGTATDRAARNRPAAAADRCWASATDPADTDFEACSSAAFPPVQDTRRVAGGPVTADVIWCEKMSLDPGDYTMSFSEDQWSRLEATFPDGVCDYSQPNRHSVPFAGPWQTFGNGSP